MYYYIISLWLINDSTWLEATEEKNRKTELYKNNIYNTGASYLYIFNLDGK